MSSALTLHGAHWPRIVILVQNQTFDPARLLVTVKTVIAQPEASFYPKGGIEILNNVTNRPIVLHLRTGVSSLGVQGVPWHTQILADQFTLFQPGGTDYAHLITTGTPRFSNLPTALQ